jgi:hypothetical protein
MYAPKCIAEYVEKNLVMADPDDHRRWVPQHPSQAHHDAGFEIRSYLEGEPSLDEATCLEVHLTAGMRPYKVGLLGRFLALPLMAERLNVLSLDDSRLDEMLVLFNEDSLPSVKFPNLRRLKIDWLDNFYGRDIYQKAVCRLGKRGRSCFNSK